MKTTSTRILFMLPDLNLDSFDSRSVRGSMPYRNCMVLSLVLECLLTRVICLLSEQILKRQAKDTFDQCFSLIC